MSAEHVTGAPAWPATLCSDYRAFIAAPLRWKDWIVCTDGTVLAAVPVGKWGEWAGGVTTAIAAEHTHPLPEIIESDPVNPATFTIAALREFCGAADDEERRFDLDRTAQFRGVRLNLRQLAFLLDGAPGGMVSLSTTHDKGPVLVRTEWWRGCIMPLTPDHGTPKLPDVERLAGARPTEAKNEPTGDSER